MVTLGNIRHQKLKNGEECLYFDVNFKLSGGGTLGVRGFQLFRSVVHPPRSRDKDGNYWPIFALPAGMDLEICANLRSMGLADKHPGVQFPPTAEEF